MTTSVGVGSGLTSALGTRNRVPVDTMAHDFYSIYGTTNPSNAMVAFADYVRAKSLSGKEANALKKRLQDQYGVEIFGFGPMTDSITEAPSPPHRPLKCVPVKAPSLKRESTSNAPGGVPAQIGPEPEPSLRGFHYSEGLALADDGIGAGKFSGGGPVDAAGNSALRRGQEDPGWKRRPAKAGSAAGGSGGVSNAGVYGGGPMGQEGEGPMSTNEDADHPWWTVRHKRTGHVLGFRRAPNPHRAISLAVGEHNVGANPSKRMKPQHFEAVPGRVNRDSATKFIPVSEDSDQPNITQTGKLTVPGEPYTLDDRQMFVISQLGNGLFEITFDGVRTRHALRMADESIRFRLLGWGGPYLRHSPEITRWLTTEAKIGDHYVLDMQRGRAFIVDEDGFKAHVRAELFI